MPFWNSHHFITTFFCRACGTPATTPEELSWFYLSNLFKRPTTLENWISDTQTTLSVLHFSTHQEVSEMKRGDPEISHLVYTSCVSGLHCQTSSSKPGSHGRSETRCTYEEHWVRLMAEGSLAHTRQCRTPNLMTLQPKPACNRHYPVRICPYSPVSGTRRHTRHPEPILRNSLSSPSPLEENIPWWDLPRTHTTTSVWIAGRQDIPLLTRRPTSLCRI
jgi:hypothetical protein